MLGKAFGIFCGNVDLLCKLNAYGQLDASMATNLEYIEKDGVKSRLTVCGEAAWSLKLTKGF